MYILNFNTVGGNGIGGADPQLLQTLAGKFHFKFEFKVAARGFVEAINMVCNNLLMQSEKEITHESSTEYVFSPILERWT